MTGVSKFRQKAAPIEALRWDGTPDAASRIIEWITDCGVGARFWSVSGISVISIDILEGRLHAQPGDWIIRGVDGKFYPCKPDVFVVMYEPVGAE